MVRFPKSGDVGAPPQEAAVAVDWEVVGAPADWGEIALARTRDQFVSLYPHPFLYSTRVLQKPERPQRTEKLVASQLVSSAADDEPEGRPVVYAVAKVQSAFPSMITVGRTGNNDIIIDDVQVSKLHAFFRQQGASFEISDAGSSNGTRIGRRSLEPKGAPGRVALGDVIAFGAIEFWFLSARETWDKLIAALDQWGD